MTSKNEFKISLDTDKEIASEAFARDFLTAWLNYPAEELRPQRFDRGEPVQKMISDATIDQLVAEWCKWALMFTRRTEPRMVFSLNWRRNKGLDPRPYPWGLVTWIALSAGPVAVRTFFDFLVEKFEPAFASLSTHGDSRAKHFIKWPHYVNSSHVGTVEAFKGNHVLDTLPGVYWVTYFGPPAIQRVGEARLLSIPAGKVDSLGNGLVVTAFSDAKRIGTEQAIENEAVIKRHLGEEHFFDLKKWTPPMRG